MQIEIEHHMRFNNVNIIHPLCEYCQHLHNFLELFQTIKFMQLLMSQTNKRLNIQTFHGNPMD